MGLVLVFTLPYSSGPLALEASMNCNMQQNCQLLLVCVLLVFVKVACWHELCYTAKRGLDKGSRQCLSAAGQ